MSFLDYFISALFLQAGYNSALVAVGAGLLGLAGGGAGAFIFLRKRALVSDAISHATLPGVGIAFMLMVALGGDGRWLPGLIIGSAISSGIGLLMVEWITRQTRLTEDAAIGAVLSVFFGLGIVLLTIIQTMSSGRQAGLENFLLGSTAGMLISEATTIAIAGALATAFVFMLRRPMTLVAFDPEYAATTGINVRHIDLAMMGLALIVTVIGLKIVGLILIVALLIIPPVTARFWTNQVGPMIGIAAAIGGLAGYIGAVFSAAAASLPTGPIIVLVAFGFFVFSALFSPLRGGLASALRHWRFQRRVHRRQGLLALARREPIYDGFTLRILRQSGMIRPDGVATLRGKTASQKAAHDEARWAMARRILPDDSAIERYDGLTPIEDMMTQDQIDEIDRVIAEQTGAPA
ncbi:MULTISPECIES: metal ABC transporter permease [Thalassospira]|mgnify:CR=1 FL=1|jgi:manganese/zinc/iron transport system permease protein|uniref:Zinc ABC transporter permease n=1 Tax=Thalassospira permensis NBRC 106175 TaxID=1353532 RepID=A0ABR4TU77_9PROT|nr:MULTISPECIES: metal ABC transporter permease [Thalassospira]KEO59680.1 zinc ABC transporter permease [Thalassospira permensis NBRC 106175]MBL4843232.1 metal ABC transporter permease [Thalassospira sp.]PXX34650.1 manganese/zinc/iron transport system permease protein [Thalassospira sp. 11-3]|tara:strand:- start:25528 stop:26748 length:1221 start_codon:yes stop_codon:yes gene_type:complete